MQKAQTEKNFKKYERKYRDLIGSALQNIIATHGRIAQEDIDESDHWPARDIHFIAIKPHLSQIEVSHAVYESDTADEWQKFRVSLKGLTTKEKMYCLIWRWIHHSVDQQPMEKYREIIRIQNYLGALVRSGNLNSDLRVIK